jgi:hypothetical protein
MPTVVQEINHTYLPQEALTMKRLIASVVVAIALLTSGVVITQSSLVGTAYADGGSGD